MAEWQERITRDTHPSVRAEHELRYAAAAPLVRTAPVWCDLGCGTGVAAASAFGAPVDGALVLVDSAESVLAEAAAALGAGEGEGEAVTLQADLATPEGLARVHESLRSAGDEGVVTCFEVIEHLSDYGPLVELLVELAGAHRHTVVLSVPNDAFWALENPYHHTMWGPGAFEELRRLLPPDAIALRQVPLHGSALVPEGAPSLALQVQEVTVAADRVPSHLLAAFGPRAVELVPVATAVPADLDAQRTWERQREATLAIYEAQLVELRETVEEVRASRAYQWSIGTRDRVRRTLRRPA